MKKIGDLLAKKTDFQKGVGEIDGKIIEKVFLDTLKKELPNVARADILSFKFKDKKIYLRTAHPAIASEIWRKREKIISGINSLFGRESIKEIKVK